MTGTVAKTCTIGGVANPVADTATIPITATGSVNTTPIDRSYLNAQCNTPSNLQLTSQNGAVKTSGTVTGLASLIDYSATALFSGASASLNTATVPTAAGPESGAAGLDGGHHAFRHLVSHDHAAGQYAAPDCWKLLRYAEHQHHAAVAKRPPDRR